MNKQTAERLELSRELAALNAGGMDYKAIARLKGMTYDAVKGLIYYYRNKGTPQEFKVIDLGNPLDLVGDAVIVGDVHCPATDWDFAHLVSRMGEKLGISTLIIAGDFFSLDVYSRFPHIVNPPSWAQERDAARVLLRDWLEVFSEIVILTGNHDARLIKWADGQLDESDIFGMVVANPKITTSPLSWCMVESGGRKWCVTHPGSYSRNQLIVASELALQLQCNIVSFHEHKLARGRDRYNRYTVINGGMLADPDRMTYARMVHRASSAEMVQGFVSLRNGYGTEYGNEEYTDWGAWAN